MIKDRSFQKDTDTYEVASLSTARLMTEMDRVIDSLDFDEAYFEALSNEIEARDPVCDQVDSQRIWQRLEQEMDVVAIPQEKKKKRKYKRSLMLQFAAVILILLFIVDGIVVITYGQ